MAERPRVKRAPLLLWGRFVVGSLLGIWALALIASGIFPVVGWRIGVGFLCLVVGCALAVSPMARVVGSGGSRAEGSAGRE